MNSIKYDVKYMGKGVDDDIHNNGKGWEHFRWKVTINGQRFDYKTGTGHFTPYMRGKYGDQGRNQRPKNRPVLQNSELGGWLHVPQLIDVAESLLLDLDVASYSFNDFCSSFGYSNDSLVYRACMAIEPKIRKAFGNKLEEVRKAVDKRNYGEE